jgi:apurinic endonuclease APN1
MLRDQFVGPLFLHGSYMSNIADPSYVTHPRLDHEMRLAAQLDFTHLILHAGAYPANCMRDDGVASVARVINRILARTTTLKIVLENVAHGKRAVGGPLEDFQQILARIDKPERLHFCLDTAHAHSFGYDLVTATGRTHFLDEFDRLCGRERLALVHLNDTARPRGDNVDRHCAVGAGVLGVQALPAFCSEQRLAEVPFLLEMPELSEADESSIVKQVVAWRNVENTIPSMSGEMARNVR